MNTTAWAGAVLLLSLGACSSDVTTPASSRPRPDGVPSNAKLSTVSSTWEIPLADSGLSVKSDHRFPDASNTYSVYADGVCSFSSQIFNTGSGDDTFSFSYPKGKCGRTWTVMFPDGVTETLAYNGGLQVLESPTSRIPIGDDSLRHFRFGTSSTNGNPTASRCSQGLVFGEGGANPAPGSDRLVVHRMNDSMWYVHSQLAPNDSAYCIDNGKLYEMQVSFLIVASQPLP
jgi:hypothetical protein